MKQTNKFIKLRVMSEIIHQNQNESIVFIGKYYNYYHTDIIYTMIVLKIIILIIKKLHLKNNI